MNFAEAQFTEGSKTQKLRGHKWRGYFNFQPEGSTQPAAKLWAAWKPLLEKKGWKRGAIPKGKFRGVDEDVPGIDFSGWWLFCRPDLDEEIARGSRGGAHGATPRSIGKPSFSRLL